MSKLFKVKEWLTLDGAANHLSNVLGEPVSIADIYKLALDRHLSLSVMFVNGAKAKKAVLIKTSEVRYRTVIPRIPNFPEGKCFRTPINAEIPISRDYWIQKIEPEVISISGVCDLAMIGVEKADIANRYQQEISGHSVNIPSSVGIYVHKNDDIYLLHKAEPPLSDIDRGHFQSEACNVEQERSMHVLKLKPRRLPQFRPVDRLDEIENCLVVKTSEVTRFIQSLENTPRETKPLHDKERTTLYLLLGSILKKANYDLNERGVVAKIQRATESNNTPVSEETIRNLLPHLRDVIAIRQND